MRRSTWLLAALAAGLLAPQTPLFAQEPSPPPLPPLWEPPADTSLSVAPPPGILLLSLPKPGPAPQAPPPEAPPTTEEPLPTAVEEVPLPAPEELPLPPSPEALPAGETPPPVTEPPPGGNQPPTLQVPGAQVVDEGDTLRFAVSASDPDAGQAVSVQTSVLPEGANFDGRTFAWTPGYDQAGSYTVSFMALDNGAPPMASAPLSVAITVKDVNQPPVANAGPDQTAECAGPQTSVTLSGAASADPDGDALSYRWSENGAEVSTLATPTLSLAKGDHTLTLGVSDGKGGTSLDQVVVTIVDTTPPVITLNGPNPLLLELGTAYSDPGVTATDVCCGSPVLSVAGAVDVDTESASTLTYTVRDQAGNSASATRIVQVVVTPNSYGLIATHSLHLRQSAQVHSGFAGVVNRGQAPFLAGKVELVVGTKVQTAQSVRLSAPRVQVRQSASIGGQLVYNQLLSVGKKASIAKQTQMPASYFPLFQGFGLPPFQTGTPGSRDVEVKQKASATLSPGVYDEIEVKQKGTLTFSGGTYSLRSLEAGPNSKILFLAPTTLLIREQLSLDQNSTFGPAPGAGINAAQILVYVEGRNGHPSSDDGDNEGDDEEDDAEGRQLRQSPKVAKVGVNASFQGNLYAPNGTIHLRQGSACVGSFIGKDLIVGVRAQVAAQSGWNTPGVVYQPSSPAPLAKLAGAQGTEAALPNGTGLLASYPNPFNPSTTILYVLREIAPVKLSVYNVLGQQIRVLVDQLQVPGAYEVSWDGLDAAGQQVAGGVYFCRLQAGDQVAVQKMLMAK